MQLQTQSASIKSTGVNVEFYVRSPFRNVLFIIVTCMLGLDLVLCALILIVARRHLTLSTASFIAFVMFYMVAIWILGFRTHEKIRTLFEVRRIEQVETGSPLDTILGAATNMILGGLFAAFVLAGFCLGALGEVLLPH
ncbi:MAG: hypothetical protein WCD49_01700 [Candidatus Acidiferrales bacterium]